MKYLKSLLAGAVLLLPLSTPAADMNYSSQDYLMKQYDILRLTFKDLTVETASLPAKGKVVNIIIPSSYGFKTGSHNLKQPMKENLGKLANFLKTYSETTIEVTGHTDSVGNASYNQKLGEKRAQAVTDQLIKGNISSLRITSGSKGEDSPRCSNKTPAGRECNRRVEVSVVLEKNLDF